MNIDILVSLTYEYLVMVEVWKIMEVSWLTSHNRGSYAVLELVLCFGKQMQN